MALRAPLVLVGGQKEQLQATDQLAVPAVQIGGKATIYSGAGQPTFSASAGDVYFRTDTPATQSARIYICNGSNVWWPSNA